MMMCSDLKTTWLTSTRHALRIRRRSRPSAGVARGDPSRSAGVLVAMIASRARAALAVAREEAPKPGARRDRREGEVGAPVEGRLHQGRGGGGPPRGAPPLG